MKKDAVINELSGRNWINMNTSSPSQNLTRKVAERCHNFASTLSVHLVKQVILESLIPRRCGIIIRSVRCLHLQVNQIAGRPFIKKMLTKLISVPKEIFSFTKLMFRVVFSFFFRSHVLHRWLTEKKRSDSGVDLAAIPIAIVNDARRREDFSVNFN